jgi:hypothetical protein
MSYIQDGTVAQFRIISVEAEHRTCTIESIGFGRASGVQWLSSYIGKDGDEISQVPNAGSWGLCIYQQSVPWIIGFFNPIVVDSNSSVKDMEGEGDVTPVAGSAGNNKEKINAGDKIMRSASGARFVVRAGGEIELESNKMCKRYITPNKNIITDTCSNYEMDTDGGHWYWAHLDKNTPSQEVVSVQVWKDDVSGSNAVVEEIGYVNEEGIIHRYAVKPGEKSIDPVLVKETYNTGKTLFTVNKTAYAQNIEADGEFTRTIGGGASYLNIYADGESQYNVNDKFDIAILPDGELQMSVGAKAECALVISPTGAVTLNVNDKCNLSIDVSGLTTIDVGAGKSIITIDPSGAISIKSNTTVTCESPEVSLKAKNVNLGANISDTVPLGGKLLKMLNLFIAKFNTHTHIVPFPPGASCAPTQSVAKTIMEDVLSKTVKVQE